MSIINQDLRRRSLHYLLSIRIYHMTVHCNLLILVINDLIIVVQKIIGEITFILLKCII